VSAVRLPYQLDYEEGNILNAAVRKNRRTRIDWYCSLTTAFALARLATIVDKNRIIAFRSSPLKCPPAIC
jgi:hypothetical protein